jgi:hypothetical protein
MGCATHEEHTHQHGDNCGHKVVNHEGHKDYLHEGHLHHVHDGHVDEHVISTSDLNKESCTPEHHCKGHSGEHKHGPSCGHEAIPHDSHTDYVVEGHLHHPCEAHCDDHGAVSVQAA